MTTSEDRIKRISNVTGIAIGVALTSVANRLTELVPGAERSELTKGTIVALRVSADMLEAVMDLPTDIAILDAKSKEVYESSMPFHLVDVERNGQ